MIWGRWITELQVTTNANRSSTTFSSPLLNIGLSLECRLWPTVPRWLQGDPCSQRIGFVQSLPSPCNDIVFRNYERQYHITMCTRSMGGKELTFRIHNPITNTFELKLYLFFKRLKG